jgi:hypothetical protein
VSHDDYDLEFDDAHHLPSSEVPARVAAGMAFLDKHRPGWWLPGRFDLARFALADACRCVVGQIYSAESGHNFLGFDDAIGDGWLDLTFDHAEQLGFYCGPPSQYSDEYAELDAEWHRVIEARRTGNIVAGEVR